MDTYPPQAYCDFCHQDSQTYYVGNQYSKGCGLQHEPLLKWTVVRAMRRSCGVLTLVSLLFIKSKRNTTSVLDITLAATLAASR